MIGKLVPCGGGPTALLNKTKLLIGRKPECDITLACPSVSGRHCLLEFIEGSWWVRDLESRNGTSINGRKVERQRIQPDDVLAIGRQRLVVEYQPLSKSVVPSKAKDPNSEEDLAFDFLNEPMPVMTASQPELPPPKAEVPIPVPTMVLERKAQAMPVPQQSPSADLGRLIPCGGGSPIPLRYPALVLGRSPECDIRLRFPSVSSRHCKLDFEDGYWLVEDLNSTNGTWVDGTRCMYQCLMPESILALHKYRYAIHYVPKGDGAPPEVKQLFSQSLLEKAGIAKILADDRMAAQLPPDDPDDRPKRYNLLEDQYE